MEFINHEKTEKKFNKEHILFILESKKDVNKTSNDIVKLFMQKFCKEITRQHIIKTNKDYYREPDEYDQYEN
jgi:neutral trehalase